MTPEQEQARKKARRTALIFGLIALAFFFGYMLLTAVQG